MEEIQTYTAKDFTSDQEVRWCPGCGDFAILKQVQTILPKLGTPKEKIVFVSGIGCSSRFPYYMNTNGIHSIHGRAPALASGLKLANPSLQVWVITGDGDGLSIGGNHFIHLMRRDIDVNVLLFNNEIYGLTKGQYSPTSALNTVSKSSPTGSKDKPINPLLLALASGGGFVARSIDREAKHLQDVLIQTASHLGTSLLEIYQNCHIFNDGAFEHFSNKQSQKSSVVWLEHGKPLLFGEDDVIYWSEGNPAIGKIEEIEKSRWWIHDIENKQQAMILAQLGYDFPFENFPRAMGVLYKKGSNTLKINQQNVMSKQELEKILAGKESWKK